MYLFVAGRHVFGEWVGARRSGGRYHEGVAAFVASAHAFSCNPFVGISVVRVRYLSVWWWRTHRREPIPYEPPLGGECRGSVSDRVAVGRAGDGEDDSEIRRMSGLAPVKKLPETLVKYGFSGKPASIQADGGVDVPERQRTIAKRHPTHSGCP